MIDLTKVLPKFQGLVGFRNSTDPDDPVLDYDIQQSESGLFVNDAHELLNVKNMNYLLVNYDTDVEAYNVATQYIKGEKVSSNNVYYEAKNDTLGDAPIVGRFWDGSALVGETIFFNRLTYNVLANTTENPDQNPANFSEEVTNWYANTAITNLSDQLSEFINKAGADLLTDFTDDKAKNQENSPLQSSFVLFSQPGHYSSREVVQDRRVGLRIDLNISRGLAFVLKTLRTQFTELGAIDIQIHSENSVLPLSTVTINQTVKSNFQVTTVPDKIDLGIDQFLGDVAGTGTFYISYLESELPANCQAIKKPLNFERVYNPRCRSCPSDVSVWNKYSPYFTVRPFYVLASNLPANNNEFWGQENESYDLNTNYGLNFSSSVVCDETQVILENIDVFRSSLKYHTAYKILEAFSFSTRVNGLGDEIKSDVKARVQFDTNSENSPWFENYTKIRTALRESFKNLQSPCFPVRNKTSLQRRIR